MNFLKNAFFLIIAFYITGCNSNPSLKDEVLALKKEWKYEFPLQSENDSINLLSIQMEKAYFTLERDKCDSLARRILAMDSTFYGALAFQAFNKWPFDLDKLKKAKKYSLNDTTIHRLIFDGDYSYWIEQDTVSALKTYTEVYNRYPNSKIAAWLAAMANIWSKKFDKAVFYLKRAKEIDPDFHFAYISMGEAHLENKQYSKAIENFSLSLKYFPKRYGINYYIAEAYQGLNDTLMAKRHTQYADSIKKSLKKIEFTDI